jgi:hypothetical protein
MYGYRCYVASFGQWQQIFASIVAVREVIYLFTTAVAAATCPVFLLLDLNTAWREADTRVERMMRMAMYVLCPHNYTALVLANRFRGDWRMVFLALAAIQIASDFASCFALGSLLTTEDHPAGLLMGYGLTAYGFILFFGPLLVAQGVRVARSSEYGWCRRLTYGLAAGSLLCALLYIMLLYGLLITGEPVFCNGWTLQTDPCSGHGICYGVAQCHCEPGYGPNASYSGEPLCATANLP